MSYKHACQLEKQLKKEVAALMAIAEQTNQQEQSEGFSIPYEIKRRENRLTVIAKAKAEIEKQAEERFKQEKAEYDESVERRKSRNAAGKAPKEPELGGCPRIASVARMAEN